MKTIGLLIAVAVAAATMTAFTAHATTTTTQEIRSLRSGIQWARARTFHWQNVAHVHHSPTIRGAAQYHSPGYLRWIERKWQRRRLYAYKMAHRPRPVYRTLSSSGIAHEALWECIHRGEGAWNANTGNGYYGGLQMTAGWYGGKGHLASSDPPAVQMAAAEAQYRASGYSSAWLGQQWPHTSPPCLGYA